MLLALITLVTASLLTPQAQSAMRAASASGTIYTPRGPVRATQAHRAPHPDNCGNGEIRCFNPLLYATDTVIPLISLGQRSTWYPDARQPYGTPLQWWLNTATILGWLLSSILALSLASLARSL